MRTGLIVGILSFAIAACGSSGGDATGGSTSSGGRSGDAGASGSGGAAAGAGGSSLGGTTSTAGTTASGGATSSGGQAGGHTGGRTGGTGGRGGQGGGGSGGGGQTGGTAGTAGSAGQGGIAGQTGGQASGGSGGAAGQAGGTAGNGPTGGTASGGQTGGAASGGKTGGTGGNPTGGTGGNQPDGGVTGGCVPTKTFGTFDPSKPGPFEVLVEKDVGPAAGIADKLHNNTVPHFNVYRPKDLAQGYCHPVITWGNGTNDQPEPNPPLCLTSNYCGSYKLLVNQLASHGFVVVASLSSQTAQGTPLPQVAGVDWMIKENETPSSPYYHHLDVSHIGATGHSQGGMATTLTGADPRITAITPICGSNANANLHGPALLICGGADTIVPCSRVQPAFDAIKNVPVMMAEIAGMSHGSWIGSIQDPVMVGTTAWMRVHLMNDTANRGMFYGPNCKWCTNSKIKVQRKMMDE